jgi:hypothetical protein
LNRSCGAVSPTVVSERQGLEAAEGRGLQQRAARSARAWWTAEDNRKARERQGTRTGRKGSLPGRARADPGIDPRPAEAPALLHRPEQCQLRPTRPAGGQREGQVSRDQAEAVEGKVRPAVPRARKALDAVGGGAIDALEVNLAGQRMRAGVAHGGRARVDHVRHALRTSGGADRSALEHRHRSVIDMLREVVAQRGHHLTKAMMISPYWQLMIILKL